MIPDDKEVARLVTVLRNRAYDRSAALRELDRALERLFQAAGLLQDDATAAALEPMRAALQDELVRVGKALALLDGVPAPALLGPVGPNGGDPDATSTAAPPGASDGPASVADSGSLTEAEAATIEEAVEAPPEEDANRELSPPSDGPAAQESVIDDLRPLEEIEGERILVEEELAALEGTPAGLARFKGLVCVFQGAYVERRRHPGSQSDWKALLGRLRKQQAALWKDQYCIPLSNVSLQREEWRDLAERYLQVEQVVRAFEWIEGELPVEGDGWLKRSCQPVLESCGAALSRFWRWSLKHLEARSDPQQLDLYHHLCGWADRHRVFIRSLQPETVIGDTELTALAADLDTRFRSLVESTEKRRRKADALGAFTRFVREPDWGAREGDDERTCDLAAACLAAGVPPSDKGLRDALVDTPWIIEEDDRLERLRVAVQEEQKRRSRVGEAQPEVEPALTAEIEAMRQQVLAHTRGKLGVVVGGVAREANRAAIQQALELAALRWPSTDPSDTFDRSRQEIRRADLVFLTRFNRRRSREAYSLCSRDGKILIVLPKGYGLSEVIFRTYRRLEHGGDEPDLQASKA